jgi:hypothetical protein
MTKPVILKDTEFEEVADAKVDAKHRVALGRILPTRSSFEAYAQQHTPSAYRIFWCCGPKKGQMTIIRRKSKLLRSPPIC